MRLTERFGQRVLKLLRGMVLSAEFEEIDYEVIPVVFPAANPDGSSGMQMGMHLALSCRVPSGDFIVVLALCEDPYLPDPMLENFVRNVLSGLQGQRAAATPDLGLAEPAEAELSPSGLIIPRR